MSHKSLQTIWQCVPDNRESDFRVVPALPAPVSDTSAPKIMRHHHHCHAKLEEIIF